MKYMSGQYLTRVTAPPVTFKLKVEKIPDKSQTINKSMKTFTRNVAVHIWTTFNISGKYPLFLQIKDRLTRTGS
jgi:hypothetical protein